MIPRLLDKDISFFWINKNISIKTKCAVYRVIVLSSLPYDVETWTVCKADTPPQKKRHVFMMRHLHKILNVKW